MVIGLSISCSMLNVGQLGFKLSFSLLVKVRDILIDFLEIIENRIKNLSLCHFTFRSTLDLRHLLVCRFCSQ